MTPNGARALVAASARASSISARSSASKAIASSARARVAAANADTSAGSSSATTGARSATWVSGSAAHTPAIRLDLPLPRGPTTATLVFARRAVSAAAS